MIFDANVMAETVYSENQIVPYFDDMYVFVENGIEISAPTDGSIEMNDVVYLHNNGTINGVINTNGNNLMVYNTVDNATINVTGDGNVVQVISADNEFTHLSIGGADFGVSIEGVSNVNFSDIQGMNANSFVITDSSVVIGNFNDWQNSLDKNISLEGNVCLIINDADTVNSGVVITHTVSNDTINVIIPNLDKMYKTELRVLNGGIGLYIVRETDYSVIFEDSEDAEEKRNSALEQIRQNHPDDKLLRALDKARDIDEINRLKNLSYRFNHGILLRPVKMLSKFSLVNFFKRENVSGIGIEPYYVMSDTTDAVGLHVYSGYKFDNLYFDAGLNFGKFDYSDDLNEFSGMFYGFDINSKQIFDKLWLGESFELSLTSFKADYISDDGDIKKNPMALSWYGDIAVGYDFDMKHDIVISPVVGLTYQSYKVADVSDTDFYLHGGADAKYFFVVDGIRYEYSVSGAVGTNGDLFANFGIGFVSVTDNFGVSLNAGILKDDFDWYYKFSLNAKMLF